MSLSNPNKNYHQAALNTLLKNFPSGLLIFVIQIILRMIALSPLYLASVRLLPFPPPFDMLAGLIFSLILFVILVLPSRFIGASYLRPCISGPVTTETISLKELFNASVYRFFKALPYILPFGLFAMGFYYSWNMMGFNEFGLIFNKLGALVGGTYPEGVMVVAVFFLVSLVLAIHGWRRGLVFDYLPIKAQNLSKTWKKSLKLQKSKSSPLKKIKIINACICIPTLLAVFVPFVLYIKASLTGSLQMDMMIVLSTLSAFSFPNTAFIQAAVIVLFLYLPLLPVRKAALAHAVYDMQNSSEL